MKYIIQKELENHIQTCHLMAELIPNIDLISKQAIHTIEAGGKIILFGNGGSAADSQHIAAELVGRFKTERKGLPAIALTTDTSALTSIGNDFGYEFIFKRQLEALLNQKDMVIGISTSGNSNNVLSALEYSKQSNVKTYGLSGGSGGGMNTMCDLNIVIPSSDTPRIQEMHIFIGHTICQLIDNHFSR